MTFGFPDDKKASCCVTCKKPGMIDIVNSKCISSAFKCDTRSSSKYDFYCFHCFKNTFPNDTRTLNMNKNHLTKQRRITTILSNTFTDFKNVSIDKQYGACSKRRPDYLIDLYTHILIVEIDEFQHNHLTEECELKRLNEIWEDVANRPMIVIRFNPDEYIDYTENKIPSVFNLSKKTGLLKCNTKKFNERMSLLIQTIKTHSSQIPVSNKIIHLFYDEE